jgi:hypothetical protein
MPMRAVIVSIKLPPFLLLLSISAAKGKVNAEILPTGSVTSCNKKLVKHDENALKRLASLNKKRI